MRIALWHDLPPGGARRAFTELSKRLSLKHSIALFKITGASNGPMPGHLESIHSRSIAFERRRPIRLAFYWNDWLIYQDIKALSLREQELAVHITREAFDLALISTLRWGYAPALLQRLAIPSAYYCHEPPRRFYEPWCRPQAGPLTRYERLRLLWKWPSRTLLDRYIQSLDRQRVLSAKSVLTNSAYTADYIGRVYGRSANVSYLGVDDVCFTASSQPGPSNGVLSVGSFENHKGFDFLIQAIGGIPPRRRPKLTLVGTRGHPRMPDLLLRLAQTNSVQLEIHMDVSDEELVSYYQSASVFVLGARHEPFGLVVLEAMACGLPVVAVAEGGVPEIVVHGRTGYLVDRDASSFASHVDKLLTSPDLRERFGREARASIERFWTWDHAASRLEGHLAALLAGRAPATRAEI